MSTSYVGERRLAGFNFAPQGWAFCQGQTLSVPEDDTLLTRLGTTYGGDVRTTFMLPDLRGWAALHQGSGTGKISR